MNRVASMARVFAAMNPAEAKDVAFFLGEWKRCQDDDDRMRLIRSFRNQIAAVAAGEALSLDRQPETIEMPLDLTDDQADMALAATASFLDIQGSALTVNREKMKARYRALVRFIKAKNELL